MDAIARQRGEGSARLAAWKVGELARQSGLSVRTLHYYDEIGLLSPSRRTDAGHRLYTAGDVVRLQQIKSLQYLGFTLREVRDCLDRSDFPLGRVIQLHLSQLKERIELQRRLCELLENVAARLGSEEGVSSAEFVNTVMEVIEMSERLNKYYTPEQLEYLEERGREVGEERIRQAEAEWAALMEQVRAEMEAGTDPSNERVQALARRWMGLVREFTGGDPGIERPLKDMWGRGGKNHGNGNGGGRGMGGEINKGLAASGDEGSSS